jgi:hypothetical protein
VTDWVNRQVEMLRTQWPNLSYQEGGHWVRIPNWQLPCGWSAPSVDVAFQVKEAVDQPPYAFYVNTADLKYNGNAPSNWTLSAEVPFPGAWSVFSWAPETWIPTANPDLGPSMVAFARSFANRFEEGV